MIAPRSLVIEAARGPELTLSTKHGAPGVLATPMLEDVRAEFGRARGLAEGLSPKPRLEEQYVTGGVVAAARPFSC